MTFGMKLKIERIKRHLRQKDVAKVVDVDGSTICDWENDNTLPKIKQIITLSKFFKVSMSKLFEDVEV